VHRQNRHCNSYYKFQIKRSAPQIHTSSYIVLLIHKPKIKCPRHFCHHCKRKTRTLATATMEHMPAHAGDEAWMHDRVLRRHAALRRGLGPPRRRRCSSSAARRSAAPTAQIKPRLAGHGCRRSLASFWWRRSEIGGRKRRRRREGGGGGEGRYSGRGRGYAVNRNFFLRASATWYAVSVRVALTAQILQVGPICGIC
jgi:hypothetical protein